MAEYSTQSMQSIQTEKLTLNLQIMSRKTHGKICVLVKVGNIYYVVRATSQRYRGSDWMVLAFGYRLALGVTTSIFLFFLFISSIQPSSDSRSTV